jgi:ribosomal protein L37AE/L43A
MAKGKGAACPNCGKQTFHDNGSVSECSSCGAVGWSWRKGVSRVGKGRGNRCPNCDNLTLHRVIALTTGQGIRRCGTCDYSLVEPAVA